MSNTNNENEDISSSFSTSSPDPRLIKATSSIKIPCPCEKAFDIWCDMPRQPTWSRFLESVRYSKPDSVLETEWSARILKVPIRWNALTTTLNKPNEMGWKSISGVPTSGCILFEEIQKEACQVTLTMSVEAPSALVRVLRLTTNAETFFRDRVLYGTLERFRDVVISEYKKKP